MLAVLMRRGLALVLLALLVVPVAAQATLLVYMTDEDLTAAADAVVQGEVLSVESYRDAQKNRVYRRVTVGVHSFLKGHGPDEILVRVAGGVLGELEYRVLGAPQFEVGEEVVLFLEARADSNGVIGMAQGKLRVTTDERGERWVQRDIASVALVNRDGRTPPRAARPTRFRLSELHAIVNRVLPTLPAVPQRALAGAPYSE
jgi:hypothetical protein